MSLNKVIMKNYMGRIFLLTIIALPILHGCKSDKELFISYSNPEIEYWGRIDTTGIDGAELYWSGTSVKINFEGESIHALLKDESGDNYFNVIIDNESLFILRPDTIKQYYQLASQLSGGSHSVEIFKRTEWNRGKTIFFGFKIGNKPELLSKSTPKKRKIEFYGNSITAGYAVEDTTGSDSPDSTYTNNYLSYSAITARNFDAEYQCICRSGIGITISWFPLIMSDIFDRLNPADSASKWDFSLFTPDVVVINLFQNDSWLVKRQDRAEFEKYLGNKVLNDHFFISSYQQFVSGIRDRYPKAKIICILGTMDATKEGSAWSGYIEQAVANMKDENIYSHILPYKGTPGHPSKKEQQEMANSLSKFIEENIEW